MSTSASPVAADVTGTKAADDVVTGVAIDRPLEPHEIEDRVFTCAKEGLLNGSAPVSRAELISCLVADPVVVTVRDEKGWTPLLWASFHGHAQVSGVC